MALPIVTCHHAFALALTVTLLTAYTTDGVVQREASPRDPSNLVSRARIGVDDAMLNPILLGQVVPAGSPRPQGTAHYGPRFRASQGRCCKAGEVVAKKRLPCPGGPEDFESNIIPRQWWSRPGWSETLANKVHTCSLSKHQHTLEKCCNRRRHFYDQMEVCRGRRGTERRRCRQEARRKYE